MSKFWIIARDVYKKNVKSAAFLIMILAPFLVMGIFYATQHFFGDMGKISEIGVISTEESLSDAIVQNKNDSFKLKKVANEKEAQKQLEDEKIDAYLDLSLKDNQLKGALYSKSSLGSNSETALQQILNNIQAQIRSAELGLNAEEVAALAQPAKFSAQQVTFENGELKSSKDDTGIQTAIGFITTIIMFIFIMTYSSIIAQEIASEKGTRIMEVLLSSMKAQTHFYGKLVGVLLVALTQLVIYGVAIAFGYSQFKDSAILKGFLENASVRNLFGPKTLAIVAFMLIGIFIYAVLSALCGSLVNKPEDTAKAIQPVTYLSLIGYMFGLVMGVADPTNILVRITSYIPFISSYSMPIRIATNTVEWSSILVSLGILVLGTILLTLFSSLLYKSNVLVYSEGGIWSSLKQSISILKNERKTA